MTRDQERAALLRAVCDGPDDDLPRLAYADWCEENGEEARANVIRHGVARPDRTFTCEEDGDVGLFCGDDYGLCQTCWETQDAGLPAAFLQRRYVLRRGFVEVVRAPLAVLLEHGKELRRLHPIRRMEASDRRPDRAESNLWYWYAGDHASPDTLPPALFRLLPACEGGVAWASAGRELADDCLSEALMALTDPGAAAPEPPS